MNPIPRRPGRFKLQPLFSRRLSWKAPFCSLFSPLPRPSQTAPVFWKKCELALSVAFTWRASVKVAETEQVLASPSPATSHIICTLWKMLSLWVDYLLTSFTAMWGHRGNLQPFREVGSWNTHHQHWNNVIMTWIIASQGGRRLSGADWPWGG